MTQGDDYPAHLDELSRAIHQNPADPALYGRRGLLFLGLGRRTEALTDLDRAIRLKPDYTPALACRGNCFLEMNRYEDAIADYDRALAANPTYFAALSNRGVALGRVRRYADAFASFEAAISARPDSAEAHYNEGLLRLVLGDFERGLAKHEWRLKNPAFLAKEYFVATKAPRWTGVENLRGKTILLQAEQGLGDTIQFSRYAALVADRGARVVLDVPPELSSLLRGIAGVDLIVPRGAPLPSFDYHCSLMSLPYIFGTRLETVPAPLSYHTADADKILRCAAYLGAANTLRVGIAWAGAARHTNDLNRSMPLSTMMAMIPDGVQCISLQKEIREGDRGVLSADPRILHQPNLLSDFATTAATMELLDLVISVDTSVAHVAAALGRPTWLLIPYVHDWRWLVERDTSPWYPTMTIFRQTKLGDWNEVIATVRSRLGALADNPLI